MRVLAWPAECQNPYNKGLYDSVRVSAPDIEVHDFSVTRSWMDRSDVVHAHWPEAAVHSPSTAWAVAKSAMVLATLAIHKVRGSRIVWTCHNLRSHEQRHPRLERLLRRLFLRMVDGVIHLSEESERIVADWPELAGRPRAVVPLSTYDLPQPSQVPSKEEARKTLGIEPGIPVLAFVGVIRPYKNVPALIEAFADMSTDARLLVAGNPPDADCRADVEAAAAGVEHLMLDLRWVSDEEMVTRVRAADVVVLAYRDVHNSSAALLALELGRPVVINPAGSLATLGAHVGSGWVYEVTGPLTGAVLDDVVAWAGKSRPAPRLDRFDVSNTAAKTVEFYRSLVDR